VRGYVPLFWDIVWANRFAIAGLFIHDASSNLDATSQRLGPNAYRLRGGGANSNRGFLAGQLGAGPQGGIRRWEASSELRIPFGRDFVLAGFVDVGDVHDQASWRFNYLNFTVGWGLRYYTILGAIRLDTGLRILPLQRVDGSDGVSEDDSRLFGAPGAIHLTIGDAF
jgi:outer membrane translocation and assembly module TamA